MPLASAVFALKDDLKKAFKDAKKSALVAALEDENASDPVTDALGEAIGAAIHKYALEADVNIGAVVSTQAPGVMVLTAGSPVVHIGSTVMPIITVHAGFGNLQ